MTLELLKQLSIDDLVGLPVTKYAEKGMDAYEKLQQALFVLSGPKDGDALTNIKIGTVLTLSILKKFGEGVYPSDLSETDWKEISDCVKEYAIYMDGESYSTFIFNLYADFIQVSAESFRGIAPDGKVDAIAAIANELKEKAQSLKDGKIAEVAYTEDCLWLCLEAMVKLLSCMTFYLPRFEDHMALQEITESAVTFAFEYGRLLLYRNEQALVTEYLEKQRCLDTELQEKFEAYKAELGAQSQQFMVLVDTAFDPQFRTSLHASVDLARAAGVKEEEILKTVEDVDDFFMN